MQKNKGITLVALVVTIIVLLILAGVSIAALTGDNGILSRAQEAANKSDLEAIKEDIKLQISGEVAINEGTSPTNETLKSILEKYGTVIYEEDGVIVKGVTTEKGYEILLADLGISNTNSSETASLVLGAGGWDGAVNSPKLATGMTGIYWDASRK